MSMTVGERGDQGRSAGSGPIVLETKLTRPPTRIEHVPRPELVVQLRESQGRPLTLLAAPPGFGKTTLLSAWADERADRVAWVSLDDGDNDPARFFAYIVAALRAIEPEVGGEAAAALAAPVDLVEGVLPHLLNELSSLAEGIALVLDDYHVITNPEIHRALSYIVERQPESLRLVLATREDPPLPLARLRARGQLCELRAAQLRFADHEAATFLNDALQLRLSEVDVERLQARTEGWPAALYLAALTLRDQVAPSRLVEQFAGDDRYVVDYLTSELLARQPAELREFLLRTSILTKLCGSLCDEVVESQGSARVLAELERSNLLLVPLDGKRQWYRYHHLFAELLQHELTEADSASIPDLHRRASSWYSDAGFVVEAAHHAYASGDLELAIGIVTRNWLLFIDRGELLTVRRWLEAVPDDAIAVSRPLCLGATMIAAFVGPAENARRWLEAAHLADPDAVDDPAIKSVRAWLPLASGDVNGAIEAAQLAAAEIGDANEARPVLGVLGVALWWAERFAEAKSVLEAYGSAYALAGMSTYELMALGFRSAIEFDLENAAQGEELALAALDLMHSKGLERQSLGGMAHIVAGKTLGRRGDAAEAIRLINRGIVLSGFHSAWYIRIYGLLALAELSHRQQKPAEARRLLAEAREIINALPDADAQQLERIDRAARTFRLREVRGTPDGAYWELSEREGAVLRLLATKLSQREIASELYVSFNTVKTHMRAIFRKLGVTSRAEAVERARELGLL